MTLGEFITQYREQHKLSIRAFASKAGMSPQQILNIERGVGSNGKPMLSSTMKTYKQIAETVGMSETDFLNLLLLKKSEYFIAINAVFSVVFACFDNFL